jgi:hypothetical protein
MTKQFRLIKIYPEEYKKMKIMMPGLTNPKRIKVMMKLSEDFDMKKLRPEISDTRSDRVMKKMLEVILKK